MELIVMCVLAMRGDRRHIRACSIPTVEIAKIVGFFKAFNEPPLKNSEKRHFLINALWPSLHNLLERRMAARHKINLQEMLKRLVGLVVCLPE